MKRVRWRKLFVETSAWVSAEVMLNVVGLDNLADYSEYVFQSKAFRTYATGTLRSPFNSIFVLKIYFDEISPF
ncbi:MAG: hypothetical protein WBF90_30270 [Rivularia sp. (in: cyanobacteria)]